MAIEIKYPRWKERAVGIASYKLGREKTDIEILYRSKKDGLRIYPHIYTIKTSEARKCPTQRLSGGVLLYLIPLDKLQVKEERFAF